MALLHKPLFDILRGFSSLRPPRQMAFPWHMEAHLAHDFFLERIFLDDHLRRYPPSKPYQRLFWKWAIESLEQLIAKTGEDIEVDSRIYEHYLSTLDASTAEHALSAPATPSLSYVTHYWRHEPCREDADVDYVDLSRFQTVTLLESRKLIESGTTGLRTWTASAVLARYIIAHPDIIADRSVVELGCGSGLLGIIVASLQGHGSTAALVLTDNNQEVLDRCRYNVQLPCNASSKRTNVSFSILDWEDLPTDVPACDIVLGADIVFDPSLIEPLIRTLARLLVPSQSHPEKFALIALTVRNAETLAKFRIAAERDLRLQEVTTVDSGSVDDLFTAGVEGAIAGDQLQEVKIFTIHSKIS